MGNHLFDVVAQFEVRIDWESEAFQGVEEFHLRLQNDALECPDAVSEEREFAFRAFLRIEQLQASGREVATVLVGLVAFFDAPPIDANEFGTGHEDFAASLEERGRLLRVEPERYGADGAEVVGYVVADVAAAASHARAENAVFEHHGHGDAVDLEFDRIGDRFAQREGFANVGVELAKVVLVVTIVDREHRHAVSDLNEAFNGSAADSLRGAVRRGEFGMFLLDLLKLFEESIELAIRDFGCGLDVIKVVVSIDDLAQFGRAGSGRRHRAFLG